MSNSTRPGAPSVEPKKARWSTAKKVEARKSPSRTPHRSSDDRPARTEWKPREDRPARTFESRDDRPARTEWKPREDRPARAEWKPREDRPARAEWKPREDRPARTEWKPREDRPARTEWKPREDRPARTLPASSTMPSRQPAVVEKDNGFAALGLLPALVERLARDGITTPFPIQTATIPDALAGRDVLGRGQTGSGKTFAFGLPMLTRLASGRPAAPHKPKALVLTPTRELAMQVSDALEPLVRTLGLRHKLIAGGMPYPPQLTALERGVDLLIATPGRLSDLVERGAADLGQIEIVVLDEADHMAEMGFLPEITAILDLIPEGGQRLLFSATLDRGVDAVVKRYLSDPVTHSTDAASASVTTMEHHILLVDPMHKKSITAEVANREGRTVVFVRTKLGADRVAEQLREQGIVAAALHGGLGQSARNRVLAAFRDGSLPVLVATDVAARGIHVDDVSVVLQVDPPADHKDYLHRSGRTARAGDRGTVVTLALPHQRRGMERLARDAGVDVTPTRAMPGDAGLLEATGARVPSGIPITESAMRRLLEPAPRQNRRPGGPRRPSYGSGGRDRYRGSRA